MTVPRRRRELRRRDVHALDNDGAIACNPRDAEAMHRADVGDIATSSDRSRVTCTKCVRALRAAPR
jgi:hypothetical protein